MIIRNVDDLCTYTGYDTLRGLSKWAYRNTDCGAWLQTACELRSTRQEEWTATIMPTILGPRVISLRRRGCRTVYTGRHPETGEGHDAVPVEVMDFLHMDECGQTRLTREEYDRIGEDANSSILRVWQHRYGKRVRFRVSVDEYAPCVNIGSIVEGVDECPETRTLFYPFTSEELESALSAVDSEAADIWNATHGCDTCQKHYGLSDGALSPVWEECPDCGGHGASF